METAPENPVVEGRVMAESLPGVPRGRETALCDPFVYRPLPPMAPPQLTYFE